ncbi:LacI family DNA-binding transcriptional regulator [Georgenia satyanarayanai]|uniref:LacI family DNA-binding transcriptional regulator n=1 Tax=Georgenia satyanarayanai TaxID=860221 RepID=UPI00203F42EB|nr:LacI family DNA-binding transcriptional regulator [Georgenia satyanarayanai]MCM3659515.1 LacI family DNA-binding transcriptional regulator [Georgenia satyanarayanai]
MSPDTRVAEREERSPAAALARSSPRRRAAPSIADVAAVAGVSAQTVSRVSTGYTGVRPETRDRVLAAMEQVGYVPNSAARALKHGAFRTIGLIAHQLARTGESSTVDAVVDAARQEGYGVTLVDVRSPTSHDVTAAVAGLAHMAIDGLIIIRAELATPEDLTLPPQIPVVVSDSHFAGRHPAVATDQAAGSQMAVQHLLGLGHRTVSHLAGPSDSLPAAERESAWRAVLTGADRPVPAPYRGTWTAESGYRLGAQIAAEVRAGTVTAVFCANDLMALGLCRALYEAGLRVPQDVSVIGFDDIPESGYFWPPLTSVAQDFQLVGQRLVRMLVEQIHSGERPSERVLLPVELVVRASTAPPSTGSPV